MTIDDVTQAQTRIILACTHGNLTHCDVKLARGRTVHCCVDCWNTSVYARRAALKQYRTEQRASLPLCERCAHKPGTWNLAGYSLCGRCKTVTYNEASATLQRSGMPFLGLVTPLRDLVDTRAWYAATH